MPTRSLTPHSSQWIPGQVRELKFISKTPAPKIYTQIPPRQELRVQRTKMQKIGFSVSIVDIA
jgi:hypothetical protein